MGKEIVKNLPLIIAFILVAGVANGTSYSTAVPDIPLDEVPDLREEKSRLKLQKGDVVVVPIPMSDPTLGTGLILGGAYFYPQTEAQAAVQPASLTGVAGMYTSNDSYAFGIGQQNYWDEDKWRFTGALGYLNFELSLLSPANPAMVATWIGWSRGNSRKQKYREISLAIGTSASRADTWIVSRRLHWRSRTANSILP